MDETGARDDTADVLAVAWVVCGVSCTAFVGVAGCREAVM